MRFIRFAQNGRPGVAIVKAGKYYGWTAADPRYPGDLNPAQIIDGSLKHLEGRFADAPELDIASIQFLPAFNNASKMICVGLNYVDHSKETGFKVPDHPTVFPRFQSSLIGHNTPLVRPLASEQFDYEGEVAVVLGKSGRYIELDDALSHVLAYSIFNDASVRDFQLRTPQWTIGKNFDGTGAFGPELVTADELPPGAAGLSITTRLNGAVVQSANTNDLVFPIARLITELSQTLTLEAGDVIITGTPAGVGAARKPPLWMKDGDICEVEVEGLGILHNVVRDERR